LLAQLVPLVNHISVEVNCDMVCDSIYPSTRTSICVPTIARVLRLNPDLLAMAWI